MSLKRGQNEPPHARIFVRGLGGTHCVGGVDADLVRRSFLGAVVAGGSGAAGAGDTAGQEASPMTLTLPSRIEIEAKRRGISFFEAAALLGRRGARVRNERRRAKLAQLTRARESWAWRRDFE